MRRALACCKVLNAYMHAVFPFDGYYGSLINSDRLNLSNRLKDPPLPLDNKLPSML